LSKSGNVLIVVPNPVALDMKYEEEMGSHENFFIQEVLIF
jgi:hypothetical protein